MADTSMLHVRVDRQLKTDAADSTADAVWFGAKVHEALADTQPPANHEQVMDEVQALIDRKRRA
ncbi:hypothetical protein [Alkalimonas cellulosilytica]